GLPMKPLLAVKDVSKSFHGLRAVIEATFELERQEIVALIGPNGAGKTTLFNLIAGVVTPDSGEIQFDDHPIEGWRPHQICAAGIARTFQLVKPFAGLTVIDNVLVGALHRAPSVSEARTHAATVLATLGLSAKREAPAHTLTLPERKRLEI